MQLKRYRKEHGDDTSQEYDPDTGESSCEESDKAPEDNMDRRDREIAHLRKKMREMQKKLNLNLDEPGSDPDYESDASAMPPPTSSRMTRSAAKAKRKARVS